jgi:autotransporter translocation and assembly factor TamB
MNASFSKEKGKSLYTQINVKQSNLVFNNAIWTLYPTEIQIDSATVKINHLLSAHNDQFLKIDGAVSRNPEEKLLVEFNKIDLDYIFQSLQIEALEFGGIATGFVNVQDVYKTRKLSTDLNVKNFAFNKVVLGNLDLTGKWNDASQGILMDGDIYKNDSVNVNISGIIYPVKEQLSINFDATNLDASFLRKYLNNVVQNLSGMLTGHIRLFGDLNEPTIEGTAFAGNCRFGVDFLNTYYTFSDTIRCFHDEIRAENIRIFDERGQSALANGYVKHYLFDDFKFSAGIYFDNFLIFNANKTKNPMFYGTAYGTGTAVLSGTEDLLNIDITMQNTENTKIIMNFMEEQDVVDYDFIRFIQHQKDTIPAKTTKPLLATNNRSNSNSEMEIRLNLMLEANPQATIEMIMDPVSDDKISGYGTGNMQIQYGTKTPLKVLGTYTIERGKYNFSFQQVIYRDFDIQEGSSVSFRGNPYNADLNVKANYKLTANLGDLDQLLVKDQQRVNTTVDCILQLTGQMNNPAIAFDLDLPNSTPELNRQVKSYIRTEEMMNRQIFYLLVLNTFYTADANTRNSADMSLLTSTLSTQLSNILDAFTDKIQLVGTTFHQSSEEGRNSTEMEFLLSSQLLNNRLIINGNFGYRDNPYLSDDNQISSNIHWIGDFDLEYKLTKKGGIRLKFFNHYNYRNYYNLTPEMTQGLGIIFRKDFNRISDLLGKKNDEFMADTTIKRQNQ